MVAAWTPKFPNCIVTYKLLTSKIIISCEMLGAPIQFHTIVMTCFNQFHYIWEQALLQKFDQQQLLYKFLLAPGQTLPLTPGSCSGLKFKLPQEPTPALLLCPVFLPSSFTSFASLVFTFSWRQLNRSVVVLFLCNGSGPVFCAIVKIQGRFVPSAI